MQNEREWRLALAEFEALRKNVPPSVSDSFVAEYHAVLDLMAGASGESFDKFRISATAMAPQLLGAEPPGRRTPGKKRYTTERFCDPKDFQRKIDALANSLSVFEFLKIMHVTHSNSPPLRTIG